MKDIRYKGHTITVTTMTTTVMLPKPFGKTGHYGRVRNLVGIEGRAGKPPGQRPFITTIREAKQHINDTNQGG